MHVNGEEKLFLVDPTYRQFCYPEAYFAHYKEWPPGVFLAQSEGGEKILDSLLQKGYLEISPEIAQKYLASFCTGKDAFETHEAAFAFLKNPPDDAKYWWIEKQKVAE